MLSFDKAVARQKGRSVRRRAQRSQPSRLHHNGQGGRGGETSWHKRTTARKNDEHDGLGALSGMVLTLLLAGIGAWLVHDAGFARREHLVAQFAAHVAANWTRARADLVRTRFTLEVLDPREHERKRANQSWPLPGANVAFVPDSAPGFATGLELERSHDDGADVVNFQRMSQVLRQTRAAPLLAPLTDWSGTKEVQPPVVVGSGSVGAAAPAHGIPAVVLRIRAERPPGDQPGDATVESAGDAALAHSEIDWLESPPIPLYRRIRRRPGNPNPQGRCRSWGGAPGGKGRHDCVVFRVLSHVCLLVQRGNGGRGNWQLALGEGAGAGAHGCDPRLSWSAAQYMPARVSPGTKLPQTPHALDKVSVTLREAADPWLAQMALTQGSMHFGMAGWRQRRLGCGMLAAALLATLTMTYICCISGRVSADGTASNGRAEAKVMKELTAKRATAAAAATTAVEQGQKQRQREMASADATTAIVTASVAERKEALLHLNKSPVENCGITAAAGALPRPAEQRQGSVGVARGLAPGTVAVSHEGLALGAGAAAVAGSGIFSGLPATTPTARVIDAAKRLLGGTSKLAGPVLPVRAVRCGAGEGDGEDDRLLLPGEAGAHNAGANKAEKKRKKKRHAVQPG